MRKVESLQQTTIKSIALFFTTNERLKAIFPDKVTSNKCQLLRGTIDKI